MARDIGPNIVQETVSEAREMGKSKHGRPPAMRLRGPVLSKFPPTEAELVQRNCYARAADGGEMALSRASRLTRTARARPGRGARCAPNEWLRTETACGCAWD